ncbi:hypothetical protein KCM76_24355 [Zooshikella marina]|uniref:Uncharacterized protein n=1 Tax=Zooshikella ganghwensis TaxID=202772 RepID=A0A4P9VJW9_9GAMM|nr:hypothetical protein [Zooshikella ganghwensis]MBU2709150.1 hypothetical protein [Zooshikella ganghwensis]RDH43543.1 hypothetical protein B9G39_08860 [Zooshikella ganghwensis]
MSTSKKKILLIVMSLFIGTIALIMLAMTGFIYWTFDFHPDALQIDTCLDAGGAWNYQLHQCKY